MKLEEYRNLFKSEPCDPAIEWLKTQSSMKEAWDNCERGDWIVWALRSSKKLPNKKFWVRFARRCAKQAKKYAADYAAADYAAAYAAAYADYAAAAAAAAAYAAADYAAAAAAAYAERKLQAEWIRENIDFPFGE